MVHRWRRGGGAGAGAGAVGDGAHFCCRAASDGRWSVLVRRSAGRPVPEPSGAAAAPERDGCGPTTGRRGALR